MTNVIRFTNPRIDRENAREQACVWLAKLDASTKNIDYEALNAWLNEHPEHLDVLLEMAELWDQMAVLSELSEVFPLTKYTRHASGFAWLRSLTVVAASVCLVVLSVVGLIWAQRLQQEPTAGPTVQAGSDLYETVIGQQSTVTLPDGSRVILNTNTSVEIEFTTRERRLYLRRGEGLFTVAKDESRPFRVFAGQRVVEAVGTAFSVQRTQEDGIEVMVTEGRVNFRVLRQGVEEDSIGGLTGDALLESGVLQLNAGEFAAAESEASEPVRTGLIQPEEMEVRLAWQHGMLLFQGEPLEQVLREFGRYTTIKLEAEDAVKNIEVKGYYRAGDVERLLVGIEKNFQIDVRKVNENHFVMVPR